MGNLSPVSLDYERSLSAFKTSYAWSALDRIMSTGNIQQSPKKISKSSTTANISCCRLCKSVEDICCSKNIILSRTARCR